MGRLARFLTREDAWRFCLQADRHGAKNAALMTSRAGEWVCYADDIEQLPIDLKRRFEEVVSYKELEEKGYSPVPPAVWKEIWTGELNAIVARVGQSW
jgi:hypothetical protein